MGRFVKGQSGNPKGRPRKRRPHVSAFDIIFDKRLIATQNGVERELTVDEALQLQTYQAALKGSSMAVRAILKMIEKREVALAKLAPIARNPVKVEREYDSDSADEALQLLGIASYTEESVPGRERRLKLETWVTQLAVNRRRERFIAKDDGTLLRNCTHLPEQLKLPVEPGP